MLSVVVHNLASAPETAFVSFLGQTFQPSCTRIQQPKLGGTASRWKDMGQESVPGNGQMLEVGLGPNPLLSDRLIQSTPQNGRAQPNLQLLSPQPTLVSTYVSLHFSQICTCIYICIYICICICLCICICNCCPFSQPALVSTYVF